VVGQERGGQAEDQDQAGDDEREPADQRAGAAPEPVRAIDRELRRGRPRQQVDRGDRVLEVARGDPSAAVDAEVPEQRDVRRRPAEPDATDAPPFAGDGPQGDRS
ncbi:MAG: hypothetical protein JWM93_157, partial [Frankiales bacterium]|nr:hypothetical protein [Frankiales bacterium]